MNSIKAFISTLIFRFKATCPPFFAKLRNACGVLTTAITLTMASPIYANLSESQKVMFTHIGVGALVGGIICQFTVHDPKEAKKADKIEEQV